MTPFRLHRGVAAPLLRPNIDTDAIIPSREMKRVSKRGLAAGLFAGWRYKDVGTREPIADFVLNQPAYVGCSILLAGDNFGCGSSREHAAWALADFGIRAIVAPGFGGIFYGNCTRNGILPVRLPDTAVRELAAQIERDPQKFQITIDLPARQLVAPDGDRYGFELEESCLEMLLEGLDPIALTMKHEALIGAFEKEYRGRYPWLWVD